MSLGSCCNIRGGLTPCNIRGVSNSQDLPLAKPSNVQQIYFDEQFPAGVFPTANFQFFDFNGHGDNDGVVTANPNAPGILVSSLPGGFTSWNASGLDHVKFLCYQNTAVPVGAGFEAVIEAKIAGQQLFPAGSQGFTNGFPIIYDNYVRDKNEDIRLCGAALNSFDPVSLMVADFFFSNNIGYAFYERLPFAKTPTNDYWAFSNAIPVFERAGTDPINEFYNIQIAWSTSSVRWLVDGVEVYKVERLGYPIEDQYRILNHAGTAPTAPVEVASIRGGFGLFTLLDMSLPNNYARTLGPVFNQTLFAQNQGFNTANTAASPISLAALVPQSNLPAFGTYAPDYVSVSGTFPYPNVPPQIGPSPVPTVNPVSPNARAFLVDATLITPPYPDPRALPNVLVWGQGAALALQYIKGYRRVAC